MDEQIPNDQGKMGKFLLQVNESGESDSSNQMPPINNQLSSIKKNSEEENKIEKMPKNKLIFVTENNNTELSPISEQDQALGNIRYYTTVNTNRSYIYDEDNILNIIYDPKYNEKKRGKLYSKKTEEEKFRMMKLKKPSGKWVCDPTAEVIIQKLEQRVDILSEENFLLIKKLKELLAQSKELQLNISQKNCLLRTEKKINDANNNKANETIDKDIDLYKDLNNIKNENNKLRIENENLKKLNNNLNKNISSLQNDILINQEKFNDLAKEYENEKKYLRSKNPNNNNDININPNANDINNNIQNIDNNNNNKNINELLLLSEEKYQKLLKENEKLHNKIKELLSIKNSDLVSSNKYANIEIEEPINQNKNLENIINNNQEYYKLLKNSNNRYNKNNDNNVVFKSSEFNDNNNKNNLEQLYEENLILKQKVKELKNQLNNLTSRNNTETNKIKEELEIINEKNDNINFNDGTKENELDKILNETILININNEDEETKKMISMMETIKNNEKKRICQSLIINSKFKSLAEENNYLHTQLSSMKKDNLNLNYVCGCSCPKNVNNINTLNNSNSLDYLIKELKEKDKIIERYKQIRSDSENKYKELIIENNQLNNKNNCMEKEINYLTQRGTRTDNDGCIDLLSKIVYNQQQVLKDSPIDNDYYKEECKRLSPPQSNNRKKKQVHKHRRCDDFVK